MKDFHLRTDLQRVVLGDFALPLGIAPKPGRLAPPVQGFTVNFVAGDEDEPDTYSFHVVVSHERIAAILHKAFQILPDHVFGIVEIGSRDAYRSTDIYISQEPVSREDFLQTWKRFEPFLLEDSAIAAGANSEEPFVEVFVDQWKGIAIHVPPEMRDEVEASLHGFGLEEVLHTWGDGDEPDVMEPIDEDGEGNSHIRPVLDMSDQQSPDIDELLLDLRHQWNLELNIDPDANLDEGGRDLGSTLWHAVVIVDRTDDGVAGTDQDEQHGGYASIWATATSLNEMEQLIQQAMVSHLEWNISEIYTIDRVAFDERPDELANLRPSKRETQVHMVHIEPWDDHSK